VTNCYSQLQGAQTVQTSAY